MIKRHRRNKRENRTTFHPFFLIVVKRSLIYNYYSITQYPKHTIKTIGFPTICFANQIVLFQNDCSSLFDLLNRTSAAIRQWPHKTATSTSLTRNVRWHFYNISDNIYLNFLKTLKQSDKLCFEYLLNKKFNGAKCNKNNEQYMNI